MEASQNTWLVFVFDLQNNNKNYCVKLGVFPGFPASLTLV